MLTFLTENLGTILVALAVLGIVAAIVVKMVKSKKRGKCAGCDYGCVNGSCPHSSGCGEK